LTVGKTPEVGGPQRSPTERPGIVAGIGQRLPDGVRATVDALGQSHAQRLAAIVECSDDAILSVDLDTTIATWNRAAEELYGYTAEEIVGQSVLILIPADRRDEEPSILARIARGEHIHHYETLRLRQDGHQVPVSLSVSPIVDPAGIVIGASKIARDITERKQAEAALARRAEEQAALYEFTDRLFRARGADDVYAAALDAIMRALDCRRASILLFDGSGVMRFVAWRGLSEAYRRAVEGHSPWSRDTRNAEPIAVEDIDAATLDAALKVTVKTEGIGALAFIPLTARGELIGKFMTYYEAPHAFAHAELSLALTIARQLGFALERLRDEDERRRAEDARELLLRESRHRIKNTLAAVQAIAGQTLRPSHADALPGFFDRLHALGQANELLTAEHWDRAPVRMAVQRALEPFRTSQNDRIMADGPDGWLTAQALPRLAMCLHELATNAAKYGALSNGTGHVRLDWELGRDTLVLNWKEAGGPPVREPARRGFGSRLIAASGEAGSRLEFHPGGVTCVLVLRL
jgi:PAS domain S-box-containing protein